MDRPDLAALAAEAKNLEARIGSFKEALRDARDATLGEYDTEKDEEISPGNGDTYEIFEDAFAKANTAEIKVLEIVGDLATQQGLRHFEAAGVEA